MTMSKNCVKGFEQRLRGRFVDGMNALADKMYDTLYESFAAKAAVNNKGQYEGSQPGEVPAVFEEWFTKAIRSNVNTKNGIGAQIGFVNAHADLVYRMLIDGTVHVEARKGADELFEESRDEFCEAFIDGFCGIDTSFDPASFDDAEPF